MSEPVGAVSGLSRFPVKSMQGERLEAAEVTESGFVGDRAYALVETETGKVASAKNPRFGTKLLGCRASFVEAPTPGGESPPVRITLPDGTVVTSDAHDAGAILSGFFGRDVTLQRAAPENFTIDQYHPDVEDLDPEGHRDTITESRLGAAFFAQAGIPSPVPAGSFFDLFPVSVLTTSTLQIGDTVRLAIFLSDPRCVMTTLAQDDLPKDTEILRTLVRHNRVSVAGGRYPCAGVYAVVETAGTTQTGDRVSLA